MTNFDCWYSLISWYGVFNKLDARRLRDSMISWNFVFDNHSQEKKEINLNLGLKLLNAATWHRPKIPLQKRDEECNNWLFISDFVCCFCLFHGVSVLLLEGSRNFAVFVGGATAGSDTAILRSGGSPTDEEEETETRIALDLMISPTCCCAYTQWRKFCQY